jgi:hypothetical protein
VTRSGPRAELRDFQRSVAEFEAHFLARYLRAPTLAPPSRDETLDVGAYVVLTHGALESFSEGLALWVLGKVVDNWTKKRRSSPSLAALLLHQAVPDLDSLPQRVFDKIRHQLSVAKAVHSRTINSNNGVNPQHLRALFGPLGVNVPDDPVLTASLETLVSMRHYWAHRSRFGALVVKSAQDARTVVADCLKLAELLSQTATEARP